MLLEATGLTVYRGDEPLFEDLEFTLVAGEIVRLEGSNGSGKTTLLRILCGLAEADEGSLLWQGQALPGCASELREQTLFLGHKPGISAELTPVENLQVLCSLGRPRSLDDIETALYEVQLEHRLDLPCRVLSAGQRRRVALARLVLSDSLVWILDEPLTALDADGRRWLENLLIEHARHGGSVIVTTHHALAENNDIARSFRLTG